MRQLFYFLIFCLPLFSPAQAPATAGRDKEIPETVHPPQVVLDKFTHEFPEVTPAWRMDGQNFKAEFMDPLTLKGTAIVYDKEGRVIRRENEIDNASYPQSINDYFIKKYPGEKYRTWASQDQQGQRSYFIRRAQNEVVWFDTEGKPLAGR